MKTVSLNLASALAGALVTFVSMRQVEVPSAGTSPGSIESQSAVPSRHNPVAVATPCSSATAVAFRWALLESTDYREYMANLRGIGCPDATIRDIIRADVAALFAQRRLEVLRQSAQRFWVAGCGATPVLSALAEEEQAVLAQLLGQSADSHAAHGEPPKTERMWNLDGLPAVKQTVLAEGWRSFQAQREAMLLALAGRAATPDEEKQLDQLGEACEHWLGELLTPDEREEFDLRNSVSAEQLRESLAGVEVSEIEFRSLFRHRRVLDELVEQVAADGGGSVSESADRFEQAAMSVLGPERFARFQRAADRDFQGFARKAVAGGWDWPAIESAWSSAQTEE